MRVVKHLAMTYFSVYIYNFEGSQNCICTFLSKGASQNCIGTTVRHKFSELKGDFTGRLALPFGSERTIAQF